MEKIIEMLEQMRSQINRLEVKCDCIEKQVRANTLTLNRLEHNAEVSKTERAKFDKKIKLLEKVTIRNWEEISEMDI